jgi:Putative tRNA binding domain
VFSGSAVNGLHLVVTNTRRLSDHLIPIFKNKQVLVVGNMKPSKFRGILSQGMLLAASKGDKVELLEPASGSVLGERVQVDGLDELATPDTILKPKQKVMEQVSEDLLTSDQCVATWKGMPLKTSAGWVRCKSIQNGNIS